MKILLASISFLFVSSGFAQQKVYLLKNNGSAVKSRIEADYVRIVDEPDSGQVLFNVCDFYLDGKPKLIGKSIGNDPVYFEGECIVFYHSGVKQAVVNYKNGQKSGTKTEYYPTGKPYRVFTYPPPLTGDDIPYPDNGPLADGVPADFLIYANYNTRGSATVTKGNGYYKGYNPTFTFIEEEGCIKDGKREGLWKGELKTVNAHFFEHYKNGVLINGKALSKNGKEATYAKSRTSSPAFKGGPNAFYKYISSDKKAMGFAKRHGIHGAITVDFIIEQNGLPSHIKIKKSLNPVLDKAAIKLIKNSPKWLPGKIAGFTVNKQYSIPVAFPFADN